MVEINILAIGRWKPCPEQAIWDEYAKRLPWKLNLKELELKKDPQNVEKRKDAEAELLLEAAPKNACKIVLDENGRSFTSPTFAQMMNHAMEEGRTIAFFIGGADGHGQKLLKSADVKLSFGSLTWPHMLVRAMLAEQIYRGWSILAKHPYHRI